MRTLRVAAYCRVSTLMEQQESSYEAQVQYYTEKIKSNPNWKLAGIYADDGKSATSTRKRSDFQSMIDDCMEGKIEVVITKSIVSAKYSCGFSNFLDSSIIVNER